MGPLFITGGTGFVGRELLRSLPPNEFSDVRLLTRHPGSLPAVPPTWTVVRGELAEPGSWQAALSGVETVVHLAAATGKQRAKALLAINAAGTEALAQRAADSRVKRFILVSSIAASFPDRRYYPYADSKLAAETAVRASRIDHLIVRPTAVFGPGSSTQRGLATLARAPIAVCFGTGRVPLQPIHVTDLAAALVAAIRRTEPFGGLTIELGGPEALPVEQLLRRLRRAALGREGPLLKVPVAPIRHGLALIEPLLWPLLPLTAGQLASFVNDGRARTPLPDWLPRPAIGLDRMLAA